MLALTLYQLGQLYRQELPELVAGDAVQFRRRLGEWVSRSESAQGDAGEQIRLLIDYDGREVDELSTGERMPVRTLTLLWQFLTGCLENVEMRTDLFIDLFYLFKRLGGAELPPLSMQRVRIRSERWPSMPRCGRSGPTTESACCICWCRRSRTANRRPRGSVSRRG